MAKMRSPNYPALSLPEAIDKARMIYHVEFTNAADQEVIIKAMGYTTLNGASLSALSALKKYGLLETLENGQLKLTGEAFALLEFPKGEEERFDAIKAIALHIPLFSELDEMYPDKPPSEENLRITLLKKSFNPKTVHDVILSYRETREFVTSEISAYNTQKRQKVPEVTEETETSVNQLTEPKRASSKSGFDIFDGLKLGSTEKKEHLVRSINVPLSFTRNVTAQINIYGESFKPEDLAYLKKTIGEWEEQFRKEKEIEEKSPIET